jgi:hypothetical protein
MPLFKYDFAGHLVAGEAANRSRVFALLALLLADFVLKVEVAAAFAVVPAARNALS